MAVRLTLPIIAATSAYGGVVYVQIDSDSDVLNQRQHTTKRYCALSADFTMDTPSSGSTKVGILSLGDMGVGIARLLMARGFRVATNCQGRSQDTIDRAEDAGVELLPSDLDLVQQCRVILSIVPPRDAKATAQRVADARSGRGEGDEADKPTFFVDLNAVSPSTVRAIADMFTKARVAVNLIDGCIIGSPPRLKTPSASESATSPSEDVWSQPDVPVSGPHELTALPDGERLLQALNVRNISADIGAASGLKMCFAAITKGFAGLVTQSFTTAHRLGVVDELTRELSVIVPSYMTEAERFVPSMPPKAYRWVKEMEEIADTMQDDGGWTRDVFCGMADVYSTVAEDEVLGKEKIGKRKRGTTVKDLGAAMAEGLERKKKKQD